MRVVVFYAQEIYTVVGGLRTPVDNDGTLDKDITSYNDIFDAFRLALKFYHFEPDSDTKPLLGTISHSLTNPIIIHCYN